MLRDGGTTGGSLSAGDDWHVFWRKDTEEESGFAGPNDEVDAAGANDSILPNASSRNTSTATDIILKWNHIVVWHAIFWLFFRNMQYLLNFGLPL